MTAHCVSLELAKKLKEAGWKKETEFWWSNFGYGKHAGFVKVGKGKLFLLSGSFEDLDDEHIKSGFEQYPAPLATEILEELPEDLKPHSCFLTITKCNGVYAVEYGVEIPEFTDTLLPNALAQMWLYLRKEKVI